MSRRTNPHHHATILLLVGSTLIAAWGALDSAAAARPEHPRRTYFSSSKMQDYPAPRLADDADHDLARSYFAVCVSIKDQNRDIREWVHYYHWLGASTIYIYDHESRRPAIVDLEDWVRSGVVQYTFFAYQNHQQYRLQFNRTAQGRAYGDCLKRARGRHTWLAFFDADEYLVPSIPPAAGARPNISAVLSEYEKYAALGLNWRVFGSSGHKVRPGVSTLEAYTRCVPDDSASKQNVHVKMIVNVAKTRGVGPDPHQFVYVKGQHAVNEAFQAIDGPFSEPVSTKRLALHHYVLKSQEEFRDKTLRGSGVGNTKTTEFWDGIEEQCTARCMQGPAVAKACCSRAR